MLVENAKVIAIEPNRLWVEVNKKSACSGCEVKSNCGKSIINKWFSKPLISPVNLESADSEDHYYLNQMIQIGIPENAFLKAAIVAYFLPCVLMVLGVLLGNYLGALVMDPDSMEQYGDFFSIVGGVIGLLFMFFLQSIFSIVTQYSCSQATSYWGKNLFSLAMSPIILKPVDTRPVTIYEK